jgi:hypothetical protein
MGEMKYVQNICWKSPKAGNLIVFVAMRVLAAQEGLLMTSWL